MEWMLDNSIIRVHVDGVNVGQLGNPSYVTVGQLYTMELRACGGVKVGQLDNPSYV